VAEPFLGHEGGAEATALGDREMGRGLAVDDDLRRVEQPPLAREQREQFVLAVAGDAGDAEDLAAFHFEADVAKARAVRLLRIGAQIVDDEAR
jgi:hypothetical protein